MEDEEAIVVKEGGGTMALLTLCKFIASDASDASDFKNYDDEEDDNYDVDDPGSTDSEEIVLKSTVLDEGQ